VDYQPDALPGPSGRGWWLFFNAPDYTYPLGYYVAPNAEEVVERSSPVKAPPAPAPIPETWINNRTDRPPAGRIDPGYDFYLEYGGEP